MTERFYAPFQRYLTTDLKTLPASLLYFYENGTTTPKTTYRDPFKNNAHANPVVAGTHGASSDTFPPIFLDGTYTVELKNSLGTTQPNWPQDNIGGEQVEGAFDSYSAITSFLIGDIVTGSNGLYYVSQADSNLNHDPTISANRPTWWDELKLSPNYNALSTYASGEWVVYSGAWYKCKAAATGQTPSSSSAYWDAEYVVFQWNSTTTYSSGASVFVGVDEYISQQGTNLNHNPVGDSGTWWRPKWQATDGLSQVKYLSGGGTLSPFWDNWLTDSSSYAIPAANTVPANAQILVTKPDKYRTNTPTITPSGGDYFEWSGANDYDGVQLLTSKIEVIKFISNGSNGWRIG